MNGLSTQQRDELQAALEAAQTALRRQLAHDPGPGAGLPADVPREQEASPADRASQRTMNALAQEAAAHTARQLARVRLALAKCGDGSYGLCVHCGDEIGYSRLAARPEAHLCIACQTRQEHAQGRSFQQEYR
ncbi:TraR/DksA family transcriptional regulator [Oxalobacteraceae bacterium A2-2]